MILPNNKKHNLLNKLDDISEKMSSIFENIKDFVEDNQVIIYIVSFVASIFITVFYFGISNHSFEWILLLLPFALMLGIPYIFFAVIAFTFMIIEVLLKIPLLIVSSIKYIIKNFTIKRLIIFITICVLCYLGRDIIYEIIRLLISALLFLSRLFDIMTENVRA